MAEEEHVQPAVDSAYLFQLPLPAIDTGLSPEERKSVMAFSYQANATMAYLASAKFIDAQIGRMLDSMKINYPDFYNNTVFISPVTTAIPLVKNAAGRKALCGKPIFGFRWSSSTPVHLCQPKEWSVM